eukprot:3647255-Prymnesium_polylepis.1
MSRAIPLKARSLDVLSRRDEFMGFRHSQLIAVQRQAPYELRTQHDSMIDRQHSHTDMPKLEEYYTSRWRPKRAVISFDATGFGKQQFNMVARRNPENETAAASQ